MTQSLYPGQIAQKLASSRLEDNEDRIVPPMHVQDEVEKKVIDPVAAWNELSAGQNDVLDEVYNGFGAMASKDKSFINEHFATRGYESHSPLLRKHAQAGSIPDGRSLSERTRGLLPR